MNKTSRGRRHKIYWWTVNKHWKNQGGNKVSKV